MNLEEAALQFKAWASKHGVLTHEAPDDLSGYDTGDLDQTTDVANAASAEVVLRRRKINFVGVNDVENAIVVFTHLGVTQKEIDLLPKHTEDGFRFIYYKGHMPAVRPPRGGGTSHGPYELHRSFYTCGSSVFPANAIGAGTLGCLVRDSSGRIYGLTNNHVTGGCNYSDPLLPILAPGPLDVMANGCDPFTIGHHRRLVQLHTGTPDNVDIAQNLDAALFEIKDTTKVSSMQRSFYDTPEWSGLAGDNMVVEKVGRTTGYTQGKIVAHSIGTERVDYSIPAFDHRATIFFSDLYAVRGVGGPFAEPGDSGSLVVTENGGSKLGIGIVFAVSPDRALTFLAPLDKVLSAFTVELVHGLNV